MAAPERRGSTLSDALSEPMALGTSTVMARIELGSAGFVQRAKWRSRWAASEIARRQDRVRNGSRAGRMGTNVRRWCKKPSHSTDACDLSKLSGIAVGYSGHPIRTLFRPRGRRRHCSRAVPLVSGTSATRCASSRVVQPSVADRGVSLGHPAVCLIRAPVVSAGMC